MTDDRLPAHWRNSLSAHRPHVVRACGLVKACLEDGAEFRAQDAAFVLATMRGMANLLAATLGQGGAAWFMDGIASVLREGRR